MLGTTRFAWSLLPPGARLGSRSRHGNGVSLDPDNYAPGDIVELRVEIAGSQPDADHVRDASPTCSVISDNSCIQRLTWRVEVR